MGEYENAVSAILEMRPEMTSADLDALIEKKVGSVGAGFLTRRGAVHLVASDLGITFPEAVEATGDLGDLSAGAKELTVRSRVMNISPVRQFTGKDGSQGSIRTMTVYDAKGKASVKLWGEKAVMPGIDEIRPGDMVRIIKAYVKADRDGTQALNIGSGGSLERDENQESDIAGIDSLAIDAGEVAESGRNMVVRGKVEGQIGFRDFTRKSDGRPGKVIQMTVRGKSGSPVRAVLWGKGRGDVPKSIPVDAAVTLIGVDARTGNQGLEIHGNDATVLKVDGTNEVAGVTVRIVSRVAGQQGSMVLGMDEAKNLVFVTDSGDKLASLKPGDIAEIMPTTALGSSLTLDSSSFVRRIDDGDAKVPALDEAWTDVKDIRSGGTYSIRAIVLKANERREIQTRSGEAVALAEIYVEDKTKEVWVKGWRAQADALAACKPGRVYEITGLNARPAMDDRVDLMLTPYSAIRDITGASQAGGA